MWRNIRALYGWIWPSLESSVMPLWRWSYMWRRNLQALWALMFSFPTVFTFRIVCRQGRELRGEENRPQPGGNVRHCIRSAFHRKHCKMRFEFWSKLTCQLVVGVQFETERRNVLVILVSSVNLWIQKNIKEIDFNFMTFVPMAHGKNTNNH